MDEKQKESGQGPLFEVVALGQASKVTRGSPIQFPWFEAAPPPFDRWCETCDAPTLGIP